LNQLPEEFARKLPRYPDVPAILLGRMARDLEFPGIGDVLLTDALKRAWRHSSEVAATVVIVDAKNQRASEFYRRYGFTEIKESPHRLFVPMSTIAKI
jgi:GNAT superfamily N-acetyltransferase